MFPVLDKKGRVTGYTAIQLSDLTALGVAKQADLDTLRSDLDTEINGASQAIGELNRENARTRHALNRLTRAIEAIQLCPHRASCPVSGELQNQEDSADADEADATGKQRKPRQQRKPRHDADDEPDEGKRDG